MIEELTVSEVLRNELGDMPPHARVWIYQADEPLDDKASNVMKNDIDLFLSGWNAHGKQLTAAGTFLYNRFLILAVDEQKAGASGCSIDSSVNFVKKAAKKFGVDFFNRRLLTYISQRGIEQRELEVLPDLYKSEEVKEHTPVFNNLVNTVEQLHNEWVLPVSKSWHKNFL